MIKRTQVDFTTPVIHEYSSQIGRISALIKCLKTLLFFFHQPSDHCAS